MRTKKSSPHHSGQSQLTIRVPTQHRSTEANEGRNPCLVQAEVAGVNIDEPQDLGKVFPAWIPVEAHNRVVVLEGEVVDRTKNSNERCNEKAYPGPNISFEDFPGNHYTHDFNFAVQPDSTVDNRYTNLLGILVDIEKGTEAIQQFIEVEWETGLGASNDGNPLSSANRSGDSGGFYSAGHRRRQVIWNWPTLGDHVHVEGLWVWDRGHPPAEAEIHPPRLIAIQRRLPASITINRSNATPILPAMVDNEPPGPGTEPPDPEPGPPPDPSGSEQIVTILATQVDLFATGDGGALWNNRPNVPEFVEWMPMSDRDYSFTVYHPLPRPSPTAQLCWVVMRRSGDSFSNELDIQTLPSITLAPDSVDLQVATHESSGQPNRVEPTHHPITHELPNTTMEHVVSHPTTGSDSVATTRLSSSGVRVVVPWNRAGLPDEEVLARTIYLYWDEGAGVPSNYGGRVFRVNLDNVYIVKSQDEGDGEYRLFAEVGGNWLFVNEFPGDDNILEDGLGDTGDDATWNIGKQFIIYVPSGGSFRVHAGGWEADGVNDVFGRLVDRNSPCNVVNEWVKDNLFTVAVFSNGSQDDPIGEVNSLFNADNGFGIGWQEDSSCGKPEDDVWSRQNTDPNDSYRLRYQIEELQPFWTLEQPITEGVTTPHTEPVHFKPEAGKHEFVPTQHGTSTTHHFPPHGAVESHNPSTQ